MNSLTVPNLATDEQIGLIKGGIADAMDDLHDQLTAEVVSSES